MTGASGAGVAVALRRVAGFAADVVALGLGDFAKSGVPFLAASGSVGSGTQGKAYTVAARDRNGDKSAKTYFGYLCKHGVPDRLAIRMRSTIRLKKTQAWKRKRPAYGEP